MGSFALSFSVLGSFLLFVSNRPLSVGSVLMCAAVSSALASVFGDFDAKAEAAQFVMRACADGHPDQTVVQAVQTCAGGAVRAMLTGSHEIALE
jgi:hypothetical protein